MEETSDIYFKIAPPSLIKAITDFGQCYNIEIKAKRITVSNKIPSINMEVQKKFNDETSFFYLLGSIEDEQTIELIISMMYRLMYRRKSVTHQGLLTNLKRICNATYNHTRQEIRKETE